MGVETAQQSWCEREREAEIWSLGAVLGCVMYFVSVSVSVWLHPVWVNHVLGLFSLVPEHFSLLLLISTFHSVLFYVCVCVC